jgi:putative transposase
VSRYEQYRQLKDLHALRPEVMRFGVTVARGTLGRLDHAFGAFFARGKAGDKPGYPRFKGQVWWDSVRWPDTSGWRVTKGRLYVRGVRPMRIRGDRRGLGSADRVHHLQSPGRTW